jgi:hypothetical protein
VFGERYIYMMMMMMMMMVRSESTKFQNSVLQQCQLNS